MGDQVQDHLRDHQKQMLQNVLLSTQCRSSLHVRMQRITHASCCFIMLYFSEDWHKGLSVAEG